MFHLPTVDRAGLTHVTTENPLCTLHNHSHGTDYRDEKDSTGDKNTHKNPNKVQRGQMEPQAAIMGAEPAQQSH